MPGSRRVDDKGGAYAIAMAGFIGSRFFAGQDPGVIGACLAELMATLLANHKIPDDRAKQERLREQILKHWCDSVRELVAAEEANGETIQ